MGLNVSVPDYFNYDIEIINADNSPQYEKEIIEEDEEYITHVTEWGEVVKNHKDYTTTPICARSINKRMCKCNNSF